ncbi:hypothetical protein ABT187_36665 [Streptomyces sp. NPDC001817]|uniref:hypothetical protein n=1 Tax=Streptomyces sp. NPDC001817 TaxID=3154398 RepID=UPI003316F2F2
MTAVINLLADRVPGLLRVLREADPDHVLPDGALAEWDRVGDGPVEHSHKQRRHRVNVELVTDPHGRLRWDLIRTARSRVARPQSAPTGSIRTCECQGVPVLADRAYVGLGAVHDDTPVQSKSDVVDLRGRPHLGAAALKELGGQAGAAITQQSVAHRQVTGGPQAVDRLTDTA